MLKNQFQIGHWQVNSDELSLSCDGIVHQLPAKVFSVLQVLAEHPGQTVSRETLIEQVWSGHQEVGTKGLNNAIYQLRKILKTDDNEGIKTISKLGYQLTIPVVKPQSSEQEEEWPHRRAPTQQLVWFVIIVAIFAGIYWTQQPSDQAQPAFVGYAKPVHLTYYEGVEELPSISADGQQLAFSWERRDELGRIYLRSLEDDNSSLKQITFSNSPESSPSFSPDGKQLAFIRLDDKLDCSVYVKNLENLTEKLIGHCHYKRYMRSVDWSPSGRYLAFTRQTAVDQIGVMLYDLNTETETELIQPSAGEKYQQLAWSKQNDVLAVILERNYKSNLVTVDLEGKITSLISEASPMYGFAWLRDNSGIIYNSLDEGDFSIWQYSFDTGRSINIHRDSIPYNLDTIPGKNGAFVYSRHQSREFIAGFERNQSGGSSAMVKEIRSSQRNLYPDYSPLLDRYLFFSNRNGFFELWSTDADGSDAKQHTDKDGLIGLAAWSPTRPVFALTLKENQANHHGFYLLNIEDNSLSKLSQDEYEYQHPTWSHDGKSILISSNRDGQWNIWRYFLDTGEFVQLTNSGAHYAVLDAGQQNLYFSRENQRGIWKKELGTIEETLLMDDLGIGDWGNFYLEDDKIVYIQRGDKDRVMEYNMQDNSTREIMTQPKNTIKGNRSIIQGKDNQIVLTLLGPSEADLIAVYPKSAENKTK